ncbi:hypothetical protein CF319_g4711 [Tilletia indica]|nr:hypothetical protein CF319_g4711 [Tilletia indica]KAE8232851.1 hypothetical protein CF326_g2117 [Tilletia indica]
MLSISAPSAHGLDVTALLRPRIPHLRSKHPCWGWAHSSSSSLPLGPPYAPIAGITVVGGLPVLSEVRFSCAERLLLSFHSDGTELTAKEIESQLEEIIADPSASAPKPLPVGALTSGNRDVWTDTRAKLLARGIQNKEALAKVESAVVVLALDSEPAYTLEEAARVLWYGDGQNRLYDKQEIIPASWASTP